MTKATLTSKSQTTTPKAIRDHLKLRVGDRIDFLIEPDRRVVLKATNTDVRVLDGILAGRYQGNPVSVDEMNRRVSRHLVAKYARARKNDWLGHQLLGALFSS